MSTNIGWTDETWNPVTGCSHVSPGCVNCYAEAIELRFRRSLKPWTAQNAAENIKLHPERLRQPLRWRSPRMIFVNSMSDLFHELIPDKFICGVFDVMAQARRHTFQVLTKRPQRMAELVPIFAARHTAADGSGWPLPNVWLGVSVEDQRRADERIPLVLGTPAAVRFISAEPLLGPLNLSGYVSLNGKCFNRAGYTDALSWVIVGGESGPNYRPMEPAWAEEIAAQCAAAGCAVFVKQDSGIRPGKQGRLSDALWARKEYPIREAGEQPAVMA